jgi:hypothetical protein
VYRLPHLVQDNKDSPLFYNENGLSPYELMLLNYSKNEDFSENMYDWLTQLHDVLHGHPGQHAHRPPALFPHPPQGVRDAAPALLQELSRLQRTDQHRRAQGVIEYGINQHGGGGCYHYHYIQIKRP